MSNSRKKVALVGLTLSVVGTIGMSYGYFVLHNSMLVTVGLFSTLLSYMLCGGIGEAFEFMGSMARFGMMIFPIFPFHIIAGMIGLAVGFCSIFFIPALSVGKHYFRIKRYVY